MASTPVKLSFTDVLRLVEQGKMKKKHIHGKDSLSKPDLLRLAVHLGLMVDAGNSGGTAKIKREELERMIETKQLRPRRPRRASSSTPASVSVPEESDIINNVDNVDNVNNVNNIMVGGTTTTTVPHKKWSNSEIMERLKNVDNYKTFEEVEKEVKEKKLDHHGLRILANHRFKPTVFSSEPRAGKKEDLLLFLRNEFAKLNVPSLSPPPTVPPPVPVVGIPVSSESSSRRARTLPSIVPMDASAEEIKEWPPDVSELMTVKELKSILEKYGMKTSLRENKEALLNLFKKNRCDKTMEGCLVCSEEEICDLRNKLCRDDIGDKYDKRRFEIFNFKGHKILGDKRIGDEIKKIMKRASTINENRHVNENENRNVDINSDIHGNIQRTPLAIPLLPEDEEVEEETLTYVPPRPILPVTTTTSSSRPTAVSFKDYNIPPSFHPPRYSKYFDLSSREEEEVRRGIAKCFGIVSQK